MDWPPPGGQWTPAALQFVQHQLAQVSNFWKLGLPAEFHLVSQNDGTAELKLSFSLLAPGDSLPPPMPTSVPKSAPNSCASQCLKKASPCQMRRRVRRAAVRAAAAAEKADAVVIDEEAAAKKAVTEEVAQLNSVAVCHDAEIEQLKDAKVNEQTVQNADASSLTCDAAVTSCLGSQLASPGNCWNCGGAFSSDHQCDVSPVKPESVKLASSLNLPPDLKISKQRPSPSAPVVLKKPVRMLDGSPAFPPRQKGTNS